MHTHPKNDNCISSFMTTKKFDAIVEIAGKVDANYAAQIEGYCSLLGEYGKKFEAVCAMLALDLIGVKVFRYSDETAEAVASGEKLLKESGTIYESFADMMSPEDAKRYLDFLENGSREGLTSAELADALLVSQKVGYEDVWDLRNVGDALESGSNTTATERRNSPGVVEGNGRNTSKMMYGTDKNAGVIPKEIADKLREKQYNNFDEFRNDFWKAVAETDYANEFLINGDPKNYYRMKNGGAPLVVSNQAINGSFTYQLHHIIPINQGGSVYSVDNLVVVTPRYHAEILIPEVHGYNGFKQFFR